MIFLSRNSKTQLTLLHIHFYVSTYQFFSVTTFGVMKNVSDPIRRLSSNVIAIVMLLNAGDDSATGGINWSIRVGCNCKKKRKKNHIKKSYCRIRNQDLRVFILKFEMSALRIVKLLCGWTPATTAPAAALFEVLELDATAKKNNHIK